MIGYIADSITNQDNLSAYFASLMTPVLTNPGATTWMSGTAYSYQISAPAAADFLVSTTSYSVSAPGLSLTVSPTGLVTGTLPTVTTPTTYTVTLSATNAGATTGGGTGSATYSLTVSTTAPATPTYIIGGVITGLSGTLVLQNNSGDNLTVSASGNFTFSQNIDNNKAYAVTVLTQPANQTCLVTTGAGTVSGNNVINVIVACTNNATGGTPSNHIPYAATAACSACHKVSDKSVMPALTDIHANKVSGTTCASCHAKAVAGTFASSAPIVADGDNHLPFNTNADCSHCHVGTGSSIATLPVSNGAKFSGSRMLHIGISSGCATCHAASVTSSTFQGITNIVVMPPSSAPGPGSHIPIAAAACEGCHLGATPAGLIPGNAVSTMVPGSAFITPAPTPTQIHNGITSGCLQCHDTGMVWLGMNQYPSTITTATGTYTYSPMPGTTNTYTYSGSVYTGFLTRPTITGSTYAPVDYVHPGGGECSLCHSGTTCFTSIVLPPGNIGPCN